jgi:hypothetical protein
MRYQPPSSTNVVEVDGKGYTDQASLGAALVKKYSVRGVMEITSCNTCHR